MYSWIVKAGLFLSVLLSSLPSAWALTYQTLEPGLQYAAVKPPHENYTKLHVFKIDLKKFTVRPLTKGDWKNSVVSAKEAVKQSQALAVINANFFDEKNKPLGLIVQDGKIKNPPHPVSWYAALLIKGNHASIAKVSNKNPGIGYEQAVQAGPRLVIGGSTPKLKVEYSAKSAVGIDLSGALLLIVSEGGIEINELAKFLALPEKKGGAGLRQALNLDGGSSTQLFAKIGDFQLDLPGFSKVPAFLGVFRK